MAKMKEKKSAPEKRQTSCVEYMCVVLTLCRKLSSIKTILCMRYEAVGRRCLLLWEIYRGRNSSRQTMNIE